MCTFTITLTETPATFVGKAQNQVTAAGGTLNGDTNSGTFNVPTPLGNVAGNYQFHGQDVTINITHKPFVVGCQAIENYVIAHL